MLLNAKKKKSSMSGEAKKVTGDLFEAQFEATLFFIGAGGHDKMLGILHL